MILTVTPNPALDHTLELDDSLELDAVARTDRARFDAGGKGINVSQYLAGMRVRTTATGFLGGRFGQYVRDELAADGVPGEFVDIEADTRVNTSILTPDGEYKVNQSGPGVDAAAVDALVGVVDRYDPDYVVVSGSLPPGVDVEDIDRIAAAGDWDVAIDFDGDLLQAVSGEYALCKPNRPELAAATGLGVATVEDAVDAARSLRADGFDRVVASLGADGAVLVSDETAVHAAALDIELADTVGAGDALLAGVLAGLSAGESEVRALQRGIAVAARVASVTGTQTPPFDGLDDDLDRVEITSF
jgi:1-phosphofructokinase